MNIGTIEYQSMALAIVCTYVPLVRDLDKLSTRKCHNPIYNIHIHFLVKPTLAHSMHETYKITPCHFKDIVIVDSTIIVVTSNGMALPLLTFLFQ